VEKWLLALADRLDWPVLTLEIRRCARSDRGLYFSPLVAVVITGLFFVGIATGHRRGFGEAILPTVALFLSRVLQFIFLIAVVPSSCSRAISSERESGRFDALAMTSLKSWEIVLQKIALPLLFALAIAVTFVPIDIYGIWSRDLGWVPLIMSIVFVAGSMTVAAIGILSSTLCASSRSASAVTAVLMLLTWFVLFAVLGAVMAVVFVGPDAYCLPGFCVLTGLILAALDIALIGGAARRLETLRNSS